MTTTIDVMERLSALRRETSSLSIFALVDGAQYQSSRGAKLEPGADCRSLFEGTHDAPLAHAGPWLIDAEAAGGACIADLANLEREAAAVTWIIAPQSLTGLVQLLQLNLDMRMPDGRTALVRFWDPRVLVTLVGVLTDQQRFDYFGRIYEWHLLHNGQRAWIGRHRADVQ